MKLEIQAALDSAFPDARVPQKPNPRAVATFERTVAHNLVESLFVHGSSDAERINFFQSIPLAPIGQAPELVVVSAGIGMGVEGQDLTFEN